MCTVLLIGAGLVTRAMAYAMEFDPGFRIEGIERVLVSWPPDTPAAQRRQFGEQLLAALEEGTQTIAVAGHGPVAPNGFFTTNLILADENVTDYRSVELRSVSRRYFDVLGMELTSGRTFASDAIGEAIVNETFARVHWRGADALGQVVREVDQSGKVARGYTIVGVVRDAYLAGFERIEPMIFRPTRYGTFVATGGPETIAIIRTTAMGINPSATIRAWRLSDDLHDQLEASRLGAAVAWSIGLLGLLLASVGVLGVFAYAVEERRREIGVRLALGAGRRQIVTALISTSGRGVLFGLGGGLVLSLGCGPVLRAYLFGLSPIDPIAYAGVTLLLITVAGLATVVPARRACRVDPAITLRED